MYKGLRASGLLLFAVLFLTIMLVPQGPLAVQQPEPTSTPDQVLYTAGNPAFFYFGRHQVGGTVLWTWPASGLRVVYTNSRHVSLRFLANNYEEDSSFTIGRVIWYRVDNNPWGQFSMSAG